MVTIEYGSAFQRHVPTAPRTVVATNVRESLEASFREQPLLRSYVIDDLGRLRPHITIFVNDRTISDRETQSDLLNDNDNVFVFQALSGG